MNEQIFVRNTPFGTYNLKDINVYIKHESFNPYGSMKDRAAENIISKAIEFGLVNKDTIIIESSSGNFGIALAAVCKKYNLHFICVIDQNTNSTIEKCLIAYNVELIKITDADENGGYLINRINKVKEIVSKFDNIYWTNQYQNPLNAESYYNLADEILENINDPDYLFLPVSSGGTITGISCKIKSRSSNTRIIAVDSVGSVIFGGQARKRYIPGLGSSIVPPILQTAIIDDIVMVEETDMIRECRSYLNDTGIMIGGSSGACLSAIKQHFANKQYERDAKIVTIFADRGERYIDSIYSDSWCKDVFNMEF